MYMQEIVAFATNNQMCISLQNLLESLNILQYIWIGRHVLIGTVVYILYKFVSWWHGIVKDEIALNIGKGMWAWNTTDCSVCQISVKNIRVVYKNVPVVEFVLARGRFK